MNEVGTNPTGVLVPNDLLIQRGLKMGDTLRLGITTGVAGQSIPMEAPIIGTFDLFPTWYPGDGTMIVGNIEELFLRAGAGILTKYGWGQLRCGPGTHRLRHPRLQHPARPASRSIKTDTNGLNTIVNEWSSAELNIRRTTPAGTTGVVRIAFRGLRLFGIAHGAGLSAVRLILLPPPLHRDGYAARHGLSIQQMTSAAGGRACLSGLLGIGVGTALGVFASRLFVPFLQIGPAHSPSIRRSRLRLPGSRSHRSVLFALLFVERWLCSRCW